MPYNLRFHTKYIWDIWSMPFLVAEFYNHFQNSRNIQWCFILIQLRKSLTIHFFQKNMRKHFTIVISKFEKKSHTFDNFWFLFMAEASSVVSSCVFSASNSLRRDLFTDSRWVSSHLGGWSRPNWGSSAVGRRKNSFSLIHKFGNRWRTTSKSVFCLHFWAYWWP